ncbi:MAG: PDZ domain-containing protein, partial [Candidatus Eremiobacteraeota bacterium]|nr:PDZ domain-containing protein [Candidatus Eremiobacteraeota bacterium]
TRQAGLLVGDDMGYRVFGLRPGDVVLAANGFRIHDQTEFLEALGRGRDNIQLEIRRHGRELRIGFPADQLLPRARKLGFHGHPDPHVAGLEGARGCYDRRCPDAFSDW